MSKNTHHYNWNLWSSKNKKLTERKKVLLKEMDEQFIDMIEPAIIAAGSGANKNFAPYFNNKNRLVIDYDESKVNYIATLGALCSNYIKETIMRQSKSYQATDVYKQDRQQVDDILAKAREEDPHSHYREERLFGYVRYPVLDSINFNISQKETIQTGVGVGGVGTIEKKITIYEPVLEYKVTKPILIGSEKYSDLNRQSTTTFVSTFGEILNRNKEKELFNEWNGAKGISSLRESICQDGEVVKQAKKDFLKINEDTETLKLSLSKSLEAKASEYSIVISRAPIDVLRMSDFVGMESCHSTGREYFYCALAESRNQGAVAYLVKTEDLKKVNLNDEEIFNDRQRRVGGINPISRVRLRRIYDEALKSDYMAVEDAIYGSRKAFFVDTVRKWASSIQKDVFALGDTPEDIYIPDPDDITLKGGSWTDSGQDGLAKEIRDIISNSIKLKFGNDVLEQYKTRIQSIQVIQYTGQESENELSTDCSDAENLKDSWEETVSRVGYVSSVAFDVHCNGSGLDRIEMNIELESIVIGNGEEYNNKKRRFNMTKVKELLQGGHYHTSYRTDAMLTEKLEKYFNKIPHFKDLVGYDVEGNVVISDDRIEYTIKFIGNYPTSSEAEYLSSRFYNVLKKYDLYEFEEVCLEFAEEMGLLEDQPFDIANEYSLQRFAEDLFKSRNHFRYNEGESEEGTKDVYSLMGNPEGQGPSTNNSPIIGIIPFEYELREKFMELFQYGSTNFQVSFRNKFIDKMYKLNSSVDELASPREYSSRQYQIPMGRQGDYGKALRAVAPSARMPDDENLHIVLTAGEENTFQQARNTKQIEVKLLLDIHINEEMQSENEIMSTMNFMDIYGGEKYDELIGLATEAFKEAWKQFGFEMDRLISKLSEPKQKKPDDFSSLEAGVQTGNLPLYTMKSVEQPEDKNEAKKNKKLLINERFKRLLRNMKK